MALLHLLLSYFYFSHFFFLFALKMYCVGKKEDNTHAREMVVVTIVGYCSRSGVRTEFAKGGG